VDGQLEAPTGAIYEDLGIIRVCQDWCDLIDKPGGPEGPAYQTTPDEPGFGMRPSPIDGASLRSMGIHARRVCRMPPDLFLEHH
jgi:hypothetical protein